MRITVMSEGNSQLCCTWEEHESQCIWQVQTCWGICLAKGSKAMSKRADGLHCALQTGRRSVVSWSEAVALKHVSEHTLR